VEHYLKKYDEGYFYICAIESSSVALLLFKANKDQRVLIMNLFRQSSPLFICSRMMAKECLVEW